MRRRKSASDDEQKPKATMVFDQYERPVDVPLSYSMDEYEWTPSATRSRWISECNGDEAAADTLSEMVSLGFWFERSEYGLNLLGNMRKASEDLIQRMTDNRPAIRRWYSENIQSL